MTKTTSHTASPFPCGMIRGDAQDGLCLPVASRLAIPLFFMGIAISGCASLDRKDRQDQKTDNDTTVLTEEFRDLKQKFESRQTINEAWPLVVAGIAPFLILGLGGVILVRYWIVQNNYLALKPKWMARIGCSDNWRPPSITDLSSHGNENVYPIKGDANDTRT